MTPFQMYLLVLLTKLPELGLALTGMSVVGGVILVMFFAGAELNDYGKKLARRIFVLSVTCFMVGNTLCFLAPNTKQLALIYGIPAVVNNEQAQKLPNNVLNVVNTWLEEQAKEGK